MSRQLRFDPPGGWHHVMHRGNRRQTIFNTDEDRFDFLELVAEIPERSDVEVHSFALMDNHYHLLLRCPTGGLSASLHHLNASYARRFNHRYGLDGHLFQGRFRSLTIGGLDYLLEVLRYIHRNPVSAGLCRHPIEYGWSSHTAYSGRCRLEWLTTSALLDYLDGDTDRLMRFIDAPDTAAARRVAEAIDNQDPAIGSDEFTAQLLADATIDDETIASARRLRPAGCATDRVERISEALGVLPAAILSGASPRHAHLGLVLSVLRHEADCTLDELAQLFGYANRSSVATSIRRFEAMASTDRAAQILYRRAANSIRPAASQAA